MSNDPEIRYKISGTVDTKPADKTVSLMDRLRGQAKGIKDAYSAAGGGMAGMFQAVSVGAANAAGAIAAVTAAFTAAAKAVVNYAGAEMRLTKLDVALAKRGQLTDEYREKLHALSNELSRQTTIDNDDWIEALTKLTQYGSNENTIERDAEAVKNLAGLLGRDLVGAAQEWGRVMQGNFQSLARHGLVLDENATKSQKLQQAFVFLAKAGGGQLEAQNETLIGQWNRFKNGVGDMLEVTGAMVSSLGIVQKVLYGLGTSMTWVSDRLYALFGVATSRTNIYNDAVLALKVTEEEAAAAKAKYAEALKGVQQQLDATTAALTAQSDAARAQASIEDELTTKRATRDKARISLLEKSGALTKEQADYQRALVDAAATEEKHTRSLEVAKAEEEMIQARIELIDEETRAIVERAAARREEADRIGEYVSSFQPKLKKAAAEASYWASQATEFRNNSGGYTNAELGINEDSYASTRMRTRIVGDMIAERQRAAEENYTRLADEFREGRSQFDLTAVAEAPEAERQASEFATRSYGVRSQLEGTLDRLKLRTTGETRGRQFERETEMLNSPLSQFASGPGGVRSAANDGAFAEMVADSGRRIQLIQQMVGLSNAETERFRKLAESLNRRLQAIEGTINSTRNP